MPNAVQVVELDELDQRILELLAADSRMPNNRLADLLGIAPSTCLNRVKSLVERNVIERFSIEVPPASVGFGLQALIGVSIRSGARHLITEFSSSVQALPGVVQLFFLGGGEDFMIHLAARNSDAIRDFVVEHLSANPAVASTRTSLIFEHQRFGFPAKSH
jgi:DNA-binding Lrp family transcriptional regulator